MPLSWQGARRRAHEIGIRVALGATRSDIRRLVVRQGLLVTAAGIAIGIPGAFALTRLLAGMLFGVTATDPAVFTVTPGVFLLVALTACLAPVRRALRVDPAVTLRAE
ncbi:MAG: FtsX-like permease family protein [Bryobacteraceae bacterium]|jgi:putative ABC transport system permease protein